MGAVAAFAEQPPGGGAITAGPQPGPLSPQESLEQIELTDGFVAELVVAEPLVVDPVAIDWGADGKLWVAEMADYPQGMDGKGKPGGRIRYLEDTDGDGKFDRSQVFLRDVAFPNGVMAYGRGVLVTAAPELFYAEDTDGDGVADVREVLYSGFVAANQQLRVNGLRYGLDDWIYCASGAHTPKFGQGRGIRSEKLDKVIPLGSRDFRIRPQTGELEPQAGPSQYGRVRDDWGNWFGVQNAHPLWHFALDDAYLRRNPHFASPDARVEVIAGDAPRIYSAKAPQKRFHSFHLSNRFTSACGISIYRDELLYPRVAGQGHSFTCAPFHNLVHHAELTQHGVTFVGQRPANERRSELFASRDRWCRPVMTRTGPDGALWLVDMYRFMIEHPQFLGDAGREELKPYYRAGDDRGRIYRVYHKDRPPRRWPRVDSMNAAELVVALSHPSGIVRDLAQRQLIERKDLAAVPMLVAAVKEAKPLGRLHALCTLDALGQLDSQTLKVALTDEEPAVRRRAVRIAESRIAAAQIARMRIEKQDNGDAAALRKTVLKMAAAGDSDAQVRQQLAYTLGAFRGEEAAEVLTQRLLAEPPDERMTASYFSSLHAENIEAVIKSLRKRRPVALLDRTAELVRRLLAMAIAMDVDRPAHEELLRLAIPNGGAWSASDMRLMAALLDAFEAKSQVAWERASPAVAISLPPLIAQQAAVVAEETAEVERRVAAVDLLFRLPNRLQADVELVPSLLTPQTPVEIQAALVSRLATQSDASVASHLFTRWREFGPLVRAELLRFVAARPGWVAALLDGVESGEVSQAEIDARLRQKLRWHADLKLRARVRKLLEAVNEDRQAVIEQYQPVLELSGDGQRGRVVFKNKCATCHLDGDLGHGVGPRLAAITDQTPRGMLRSILDPNQAVEGKYVAYSAITNDGRSYSGVLASETSTSLTLREADGKGHVILRRDLDELQSTGRSLMPEGLEKDLSPQDVADVIAFVTRDRTDEDEPVGETPSNK